MDITAVKGWPIAAQTMAKPVPVLQASEEALEKFPVPQRAAPAEPAQPTQAPAPVVYPPLEPAAR